MTKKVLTLFSYLPAHQSPIYFIPRGETVSFALLGKFSTRCVHLFVKIWEFVASKIYFWKTCFEHHENRALVSILRPLIAFCSFNLALHRKQFLEMNHCHEPTTEHANACFCISDRIPYHGAMVGPSSADRLLLVRPNSVSRYAPILLHWANHLKGCSEQSSIICRQML